jgi:hypothetical protein
VPGFPSAPLPPFSPAGVSAWLDELAAETGDRAFRRGANAIRRTPSGGRPPKDDAAAVAQLGEFIREHPDVGEFSAAMIIARGFYRDEPRHRIEPNARRILRKLRREKTRT